MSTASSTAKKPPRRIRRKLSPADRAFNNKDRAKVVPLHAAAEMSTDITKNALSKLRRGGGAGTSAPSTTTEDVSKSLTLNPGATPTATQTTSEDPFASVMAQGLTIQPPFDVLTLAVLPEQSSELGQTIEAMETNIDGTGHRFVPRVVGKEEDIPDAMKKLIKAENVRLQNFFMYATTESFSEFRMRLRKDKETTGGCYFEVLRDSKGQISGFTHMPSYQVRLGRLEDQAHLVDRKILELQVDDSVEVKTVKQWKRFRKFVQSRFISHGGSLNSAVSGHKVRWFKEFGDPRTYNVKTGKEMKGKELKAAEQTDIANEVIFIRLYSPRTPYGLPRYVGNLLSIFGDRAAEEINYTTFRNNNIPSMAVLVSGGQLTEGTIERIESFVESNIQGSDNMSKFLIVEAEGDAEDGEDGGQVRIEIKPLTSDQHTDALFQVYSANNQDKIRRAFRLPPIFVGRSDDYSRSTAETSRRLADEQIFAPERMVWDELMNRVIFPEMGIVFHKYKSNTPNTTDNQQLVKILAGAEKTGGMTPRIARLLLEDILGQPLPELDPSFPADIPFSITMAEAVKNAADATEPGQQVTALKSLTALLGGDSSDLDDDDDDEAEDSVIKSAKRVAKLSDQVEQLWRLRTERDAAA